MEEPVCPTFAVLNLPETSEWREWGGSIANCQGVVPAIGEDDYDTGLVEHSSSHVPSVFANSLHALRSGSRRHDSKAIITT